MEIPTRRLENIQRRRSRYGKMLNLYYMDEQVSAQLTFTTILILLVYTWVFVFYSVGSFSSNFLRFAITQYFNVSFLTVAIRCWWLYYCDKYDNTWVISTKIIMSSLALLVSFAISLLSIIFMMVVRSSEDDYIGNITFVLTYLVMVCSLCMNIANWVKMVHLIIVFARQEVNHPSRRHYRVPSLDRRPASQEALQTVEESLALQFRGLRSSNRNSRHRRILRHLRHRGVNEDTLQTIQNILHVALERHVHDTPEERVKIYSRIERELYCSEKHSNYESCPICWDDFTEDQHIKPLPECNHIFHEDCIEQWILKARSNKIMCPVWRIDIKGKLDSLNINIDHDEEQNEGQMSRNGVMLQIPNQPDVPEEPDFPENDGLQQDHGDEDDDDLEEFGEEYQNVNSIEVEFDEDDLYT